MKTTTTTDTYSCDRCPATQVDRPFTGRGKVHLTYDLHDYQGAAVAGFDKTYELCPGCLCDIIFALAQKVDVTPEQAQDDPTPPCPECVQGKHDNCDGDSWDPVADAPSPCPCSGAGHVTPQPEGTTHAR